MPVVEESFRLVVGVPLVAPDLDPIDDQEVAVLKAVNARAFDLHELVDLEVGALDEGEPAEDPAAHAVRALLLSAHPLERHYWGEREPLGLPLPLIEVLPDVQEGRALLRSPVV